LFFFIRWLITSGNPGRRATSAQETESALDILNKRYARGELSKQEYEDMRRDIL
jgi:putative membrane protein